MNSKIKHIDPPKTSGTGWTTVMVELENGTKGEVFLGKNITSHDLVVGMELNYTTEESQYGLKLKVVGLKNGKFQQSGGGGKPQNSAGQTIGNAINNAVLLVCHGKIELKEIKPIAERIIEIGIELKDKFKDRL